MPGIMVPQHNRASLSWLEGTFVNFQLLGLCQSNEINNMIQCNHGYFFARDILLRDSTSLKRS